MTHDFMTSTFRVRTCDHMSVVITLKPYPNTNPKPNPIYTNPTNCSGVVVNKRTIYR